MLPLLGVHPLRGSVRRYTAATLSALVHNSTWQSSGSKTGLFHAAGATEHRAWVALDYRSFSSEGAAKANASVPGAAVGLGASCSPIAAVSLPGGASKPTGPSTGSLSPSAAAALGVIKSAYEQMCRRSVSLNIHVHHQAIRTQSPKPAAAAATVARSSAAARRAAASPLTSAASSGADKAAASRKMKQLTRSERRSFEGHLRRFQLMGDKSEFHHVDRNRNGRIFEPYHIFSLSITTSKNNVHCVVRNNSSNKRTVFASFAGKLHLLADAAKSCTEIVMNNLRARIVFNDYRFVARSPKEGAKWKTA